MQILIRLLLRSPWGLQALIYLAAGLVITCIGLGVMVEIQSTRLDAASAREAALGDKLNDQNRAVAEWKAAAGRQADRVSLAGQKAEKIRTVTVERVRTIAVAKIPPACPDAIKWAADQGAAFSLRWEGEQ